MALKTLSCNRRRCSVSSADCGAMKAMSLNRATSMRKRSPSSERAGDCLPVCAHRKSSFEATIASSPMAMTLDERVMTRSIRRLVSCIDLRCPPVCTHRTAAVLKRRRSMSSPIGLTAARVSIPRSNRRAATTSKSAQKRCCRAHCAARSRCLPSIPKTTSSFVQTPVAAPPLPMRRQRAGVASRRASDGSRNARYRSMHAVTAMRAEFAEPFFTCTAAPCIQPTVLVPAGNRLPGIPAYTSFIEAVYRVRETDITLDWRAQSKISVDDRNTDNASGYGTVNLAVARTFVAGPAKLRAFLRIDNVLNARYIGSVIVNEANGRYFESAPGRTWLLGLDARVP